MQKKFVRSTGLALFVIVFTLYLTSNSVFALIENPAAHITEEVTYYYNANGSVSYFIAPVGYVEVESPNTHDVLQYLKLNLSNAELAYTNILSNTAYASVAASPNIGDKTRISLNTDNSPKDVSYRITDANMVPVIGLTFNYQNIDGGSDLSAGKTNTLLYNIFIESTKNLDDVTLSFKVPVNNYGSIDAATLYNPSVAEGIIAVFDSDGDSIDDSLVWQGDLTVAGINVYVSADTTPGINFDESSYALDLMCTSCVSAIDSGPTFTGLSFSDLFSRGPIHNGIYIMFSDNASVRGFMKNIARGLTYAVDGWKLYNISNFETPILEDSTPFILYPNDMYNTGFYQISNASEKYFSVAFDWGVIWNPSVYTGITRSFIDLPIIYEGDISLGKSSTHILSDDTASVVVAATYIGSENLNIFSMSFNSTVPHQSEGGVSHVWDVIDWSNVAAYHINPSGSNTLIDVTPDMVVIQMPTETDDGFVYLNIDNLSDATGDYLKLNNDIRIMYNLSTTPLDTQNIFLFNTTVVAKTASGTPLIKTIIEDVTLYGAGIVSETPPAGDSGSPGGVPPPSEPVMELVKDAMELNLLDSNTADISGTYKLIDSEDVGLNNLTLMLDIPENALIFNPQSIVIMRYDSKLGYWVIVDNQYITLSGDYTYISDKAFFEVNINNYGIAQSGPILRSDDLLKISYVMTLPYGSYDLMLRAQIPEKSTITQSGLKETDIHIPLRITNNVNPAESLMINESPFEIEEIYVGVSPIWTKTIDVYNPNAYSMSHIFDISLLSDFLNVDLTESNTSVISSIQNVADDLSINWKETFKENESKTYVLNVTTAPVIRVIENYTVLDTTGKDVSMLATIILKNPSSIDYPNVTFFYAGNLDIINITDSVGNLLVYEVKDDNKIKIIIPSIKKNSTESIYIIYNSHSDILKVSLDTLEYVQDTTKYDILYVPSQDEKKISLSVEVLGPVVSNKLTTVYADVILLENISDRNEVNIFDTLKFHPLSAGVHTIFVRAYSKNRLIGEDFETFRVETDPIKNIYSVNSYTFAIISILILFILLARIYKKKGFNDSLKNLKKKLDTI